MEIQDRELFSKLMYFMDNLNRNTLELSTKIKLIQFVRRIIKKFLTNLQINKNGILCIFINFINVY